MYKNSRNRRKPDFIILLTVFVCLGVVVTTTVSAAEPTDRGWGIQLKADRGCDTAAAEWQTCGNWREGPDDFHADTVQAPQRAALRLSSERLPETGLVAYYTLPDNQQLAGKDAELQFTDADHNFASGYDNRQFGMALKQQYGRFGMSLGFEADGVEDLTNDPLIYFGVSNRW